MEEIQEAIKKAVQNSLDKGINDLDKPTFQFVATYNAGVLPMYRNHLL